MPAQADSQQRPARAGLVCNPVHMSCFWSCCCFWNCFRNRSRGQATFRTCLQLSAPPWKHTCPLGMMLVGTHPHVSPFSTTEREEKHCWLLSLWRPACNVHGKFCNSRDLRSSREKYASYIQLKQMWDIWVEGKEEKKFQWLQEQSCYYWLNKKRPLWKK